MLFSKKIPLVLICLFLNGCLGGSGGEEVTAPQSPLLDAQKVSQQAALDSDSLQTLEQNESVSSPYYLRIIEENSDDLKLISLPSINRQKIPFFFRDEQLIIQSEVYENIKNGIQSEGYGLKTDPSLFDPKQAALFIEYHVVFNGKGRNLTYVRYFIFKDLPAVLERESNSPSGSVFSLGLGESLSVLNTIRNIPEQIKISQKEGNLIANDIDLKIREKIKISENSRNINVKKELIKAPKLEEENPDLTNSVELVDFGESQFSTTLFIENLGNAHDEIRVN